MGKLSYLYASIVLLVCVSLSEAIAAPSDVVVNLDGRARCSGFLLGKYSALAPATCLQNIAINRISAIMNDGIVKPVSRITIHPQFDPIRDPSKYNVAVMIFPTSINISATVFPITCLNDQYSNYSDWIAYTSGEPSLRSCGPPTSATSTPTPTALICP